MDSGILKINQDLKDKGEKSDKNHLKAFNCKFTITYHKITFDEIILNSIARSLDTKKSICTAAVSICTAADDENKIIYITSNKNVIELKDKV